MFLLGSPSPRRPLHADLPFFVPASTAVAGVQPSVVLRAVAGMEVGTTRQVGAAGKLIVRHEQKSSRA
jgi:hypothetical protein